MRVPISYALTHPERAATPAPRLDLAAQLELTFEPPDLAVFRCLALARAAGEAGGTAPCALNAANEVAVAAFLAGGLPFVGIADVVERVLDQDGAAPVESLEQVLETDRLARRLADEAVAVTA
jgi:1-deoxy-D-xylulose-5-phosphate reductoisomerase